MNQVVPMQPTTAGLVPSTMREAMDLATMMATARLVPQALQKSPADCLMVIQQAVRWQMDPFAVAQECSVIQGKLMHSGKLVAAVVNSRGDLGTRLSFTYMGTGDARTITVSGVLRGETDPRTVTVRLGDAKTNNKVWQTQPDQQLMYHGTRVWARRHMPELMLGVYSPEEFDEPGTRPAPAPHVNGGNGASPIQPQAIAAPTHDPETGEVGPHMIPDQPGNGVPKELARGQKFIAAVNSSNLLEELNEWWHLNHGWIVPLKESSPKVYDYILAACKERKSLLKQLLDSVQSEGEVAAAPAQYSPELASEFTPDAFVADLKAALSGCTNLNQVIEIRRDLMVPARGRCTPEVWNRATEIYESAYAQLSGPIDESNVD